MGRKEQVLDDPELLDIMLQDKDMAPPVYKETNYWSVYEKIFLPELKKHGLTDFRRRRHSVLASFGAVDVKPAKWDIFKVKILHNHYTRKIGPFKNVMYFLERTVNKMLGELTMYDINPTEMQKIMFNYTNDIGLKTSAKPLSDLNVSLAGNPEDVFSIGGRNYTISMLNYYLRYVYCAQFINFEDIKVIAELGSGAGKQIELIKKLHPKITFFLFDIPPQLYVCEQYLKAVFPDDVISYRDLRSVKHLESKEGKIFIFGSWQFPLIEAFDVDLFWNAQSFQEMEPDVVENYALYINKNVKNIFLQERMEGKEIAKKVGLPGVLKRITFAHYKEFFSNFELIDISNSKKQLGALKNYSDSFWKRKTKL